MQHCKTGDQARRQRGGEGVKVKIKVNADLYSECRALALRYMYMAGVLKGSHSFSCTPRVRPLTE